MDEVDTNKSGKVDFTGKLFLNVLFSLEKLKFIVFKKQNSWWLLQIKRFFFRKRRLNNHLKFSTRMEMVTLPRRNCSILWATSLMNFGNKFLKSVIQIKMVWFHRQSLLTYYFRIKCQFEFLRWSNYSICWKAFWSSPFYCPSSYEYCIYIFKNKTALFNRHLSTKNIVMFSFQI